jgi:hypothetical protein
MNAEPTGRPNRAGLAFGNLGWLTSGVVAAVVTLQAAPPPAFAAVATEGWRVILLGLALLIAAAVLVAVPEGRRR